MSEDKKCVCGGIAGPNGYCESCVRELDESFEIADKIGDLLAGKGRRIGLYAVSGVLVDLALDAGLTCDDLLNTLRVTYEETEADRRAMITVPEPPTN